MHTLWKSNKNPKSSKIDENYQLVSASNFDVEEHAP